jgi:hypothetical protein
MTVCMDCGASRGGPLCPACTRTAEVLGFSVEERLAVLGAPVLDMEQAS